MKMNRYFYFTLLAGILSIANTRSMEIEKTEYPTLPTIVEEYNKERDWKAVTDIFRESWELLVLSGPYRENLIEILFTPHNKNDDSNLSKYMKVMRRDNQTIGFATLYMRDLEKQGSIEVFGIAKEHQRHYNGTTLLNYSIDELAKLGATHTLLHVAKSNEPAMAFYEKRGFAIKEPAFRNKEGKFLGYLMNRDNVEKNN